MENHGLFMIIGGSNRKKHEKRLDDSRLSLTLVRIGNAAVNEGPWIFLYKVKSNPNNDISGVALFSQHSAPVGSHFYPTPNEYLTGNAWLELSTITAKGIRAIPVIRDHPDWWVSLSLYGFGSHVNVDAANENFTKLKIWIMKEEADTSQTCQVYDQLQAKKEKSCMRPLVDLVASHCRVINQWQLIVICLQAPKKKKPKDWIFVIQDNQHTPKTSS